MKSRTGMKSKSRADKSHREYGGKTHAAQERFVFIINTLHGITLADTGYRKENQEDILCGSC